MSPILEKFWTRPAGGQEHPVHEDHARLRIAVVFTSVEPTLAALREACKHAGLLNARLDLIVPQIVPYPRPLTSPPVLLEFNERRFRVIAAESPVETAVRIYLCRDRDETLRKVLPNHSLVVIGGRRHWWPTEERRLARALRRAGHEVVLVES